MKKLVLASLALLFVCSSIPAMAGEKSLTSQEPAAFQALSKLSVPGQVVLNKMNDKQLSKVEGAKGFSFNYQRNSSKIRVNNFAACLAICGNVTNISVVQINSN